MRSFLSLVTFLVGFSFVTSETAMGNSQLIDVAEEKCPDEVAYIGLFKNGFGFSAVIPDGYEGLWNSAVCVKSKNEGCVCMGDHGRLIPLSGKARIDLYAGYNGPLYESPSDAIDSHLEYVEEQNARKGTLKILKRFSTNLDTLKAERAIVRYTDDKTGIVMIEDVSEALRSIIRSKDHIPSHNYTVSLLTPEEYYEVYRRVLEQVLGSWKVMASEDGGN